MMTETIPISKIVCDPAGWRFHAGNQFTASISYPDADELARVCWAKVAQLDGRGTANPHFLARSTEGMYVRDEDGRTRWIARLDQASGHLTLTDAGGRVALVATQAQLQKVQLGIGDGCIVEADGDIYATVVATPRGWVLNDPGSDDAGCRRSPFASLGAALDHAKAEYLAASVTPCPACGAPADSQDGDGCQTSRAAPGGPSEEACEAAPGGPSEEACEAGAALAAALEALGLDHGHNTMQMCVDTLADDEDDPGAMPTPERRRLVNRLLAVATFLNR